MFSVSLKCYVDLELNILIMNIISKFYFSDVEIIFIESLVANIMDLKICYRQRAI